MIKEAQQILDRAQEALDSAHHDLKGGFTLAATNRSYYTCYYCMAALLHTKNVYAKTHQGVRAKFAELFIKSGIFSEDLSQDISLIFRSRQEADYDFETDITTEEAMELLGKATEFLNLAKAYFGNLSAKE